MSWHWEMINTCIAFDCVVLLKACVRRLHESLRRDLTVVDITATLNLCPHCIHILVWMSFDKVCPNLRSLIVVDDALRNEFLHISSII